MGSDSDAITSSRQTASCQTSLVVTSEAESRNEAGCHGMDPPKSRCPQVCASREALIRDMARVRVTRLSRACAAACRVLAFLNAGIHLLPSFPSSVDTVSRALEQGTLTVPPSVEQIK